MPFQLYSEYQLWYRLLDYLDLTAGISENYSKVNSNFFNDHSGFNIAGFTQLEIRPLNRLKAVAGFRLENYTLDGIHDKTVPYLRGPGELADADLHLPQSFIRTRLSLTSQWRKNLLLRPLGSVRIIANPISYPNQDGAQKQELSRGVLLGKIAGQADFSVFLLHNSNLIEYMFGLYPEGLGFQGSRC